MDAYTAFSKVYDALMENIPYELWADKISEWILKYGISKPVRNAADPLESERNLVLDLGCGTGVLTRLMYDKGYDLMGIDLSPEMLDEAMKKEELREETLRKETLRKETQRLDGRNEADGSEAGGNDDSGIMYICQDMCELDLFSTIGTVYSSCDTVNYLLEDEEVMACFEGVSKFLYPGGLFIFDFNTVYKYRDVIGETTIAENAEDVSFIWENCFDEESNINECDLTLFIREDAKPDFEADAELGAGFVGKEVYIKQEETHYQRGFTLAEIRDFLKKAGLSLVKAVDEREILGGAEDSSDEVGDIGGRVEKIDDGVENIGDGVEDISDDAERIFVIARKEAMN